MTRTTHGYTKALTQLHLAVFLYGFTAILGDLIHLDAISLVWWRLLLTSVSLAFLSKVLVGIRRMSSGELSTLGWIGCIVVAHWIAFFASVKLANASVALVCYSTTAVFTALLAPLFSPISIRRSDLTLGIIVIIGMIFVTKGIDLDMMLGFWVGIASAILIAIFTHYNKRMVTRYRPELITLVELGCGFLALSVGLGSLTLVTDHDFQWWPRGMDWLYLMILALLCTTVGYILQLKALRHLTAFASNLAMNLEPIYGIILAYFFLNEGAELDINFYLGVCIILSAVIIHSFLLRANSIS